MVEEGCSSLDHVAEVEGPHVRHTTGHGASVMSDTTHSDSGCWDSTEACCVAETVTLPDQALARGARLWVTKLTANDRENLRPLMGRVLKQRAHLSRALASFPVFRSFASSFLGVPTPPVPPATTNSQTELKLSLTELKLSCLIEGHVVSYLRAYCVGLVKGCTALTTFLALCNTCLQLESMGVQQSFKSNLECPRNSTALVSKHV